MAIEAIFFDADHTLYDLKHEEALNQLALFIQSKTGISSEDFLNEWLKENKRIKNSINPDDKKKDRILKRVLKNLGLEVEPFTINEALNIFWDKITENLVFNEEVNDILLELRKNYHLVVISEEFKRWLVKKLNTVFGNYTNYFDFLVTPEDTGVMKPSIKFYELPLKRLQLKPSEVVIVGDSEERDLSVPKRLGMKTFLVKNPGEIEGLIPFLR